jgi:hypothetical protein
VPELVTGEPETLKPVGAERATDETVAPDAPRPRVEVATQVGTPPTTCIT